MTSFSKETKLHSTMFHLQNALKYKTVSYLLKDTVEYISVLPSQQAPWCEDSGL